MERVLFVINADQFGGLEIVLLDWLSGIDFSRVSVSICCYGTDALRQKLAASGLPVASVKLPVVRGEPRWKAISKWLRLFVGLRADKIVFLEAVLSEFNATPVLAAWLNRPREMFLFEANWGRSVETSRKRTLHYGFLPGLGLYRYTELLRQRLRGWLAHHTFVVSHSIKDNLVAHYGYPGNKTSVLYHGVDTARFRLSPNERLDYRHAHGIPDSATVIVSHGRLVQRKRVDRILSAFDVLSTEYPDLWVLLTCYGPLQEQVEKIVAGIQAKDRIRLVGFQPDPSLILKASDIYVLSSNDEGFGIAVVEALSTGLLCVATNGPGPRDIIQDDQNGILVEQTDEGVLSGLRRALTLCSCERDRITQNARKTVENRFEIGMAIRTALDAMEIAKR